MLGWSNLLHIIQRVPGNRAQVGNDRTSKFTTTSSNLMMRSLVATREDACPSLPVVTTTIPQVIMNSRWNMLISTPGSPPSRRTSMRFRTLCTNIPSGKKKQDNALPPSNNTRGRRTRIGSTYSRVSTYTRPSERPQQQPAWGRSPHYFR